MMFPTQSSTKVLWTADLQPALHRHWGAEIMTEFSFLGEMHNICKMSSRCQKSSFRQNTWPLSITFCYYSQQISLKTKSNNVYE